MTNDEFGANYTTRAGGSFGGNSQLTQHVINRKTKRTLCGRDTATSQYRSGWTHQFDHMLFQFEDYEFGRGDCRRCAKSARKLGFTDTMFHPPASTPALQYRLVDNPNRLALSCLLV